VDVVSRCLYVTCLKGTLLDEASGVRKKETELVVVSKTPKQPSSGGWNKVLNLYSVLQCKIWRLCIQLRSNI